MASGTKRFQKLWRAARDLLPAPPADLRYLRRPHGRVGVDAGASARSDIITFLNEIYNSVAETLPDFRDELGATGGTVKINVEDPYSKALHDESVDPDLLPKPKTKPRKKKGQVQINLERTSKTMEERWLPPGSMKEYFEQYRLQSGLEKPGSFVTFWRVPWCEWGL